MCKEMKKSTVKTQTENKSSTKESMLKNIELKLYNCFHLTETLEI